MERTAKFRGYSKELKAWIYGAYFYNRNELDEDFIINNAVGLDKVEHFTGVRVENKSVGEFTGLKDKNGKEIYEGDILERSESLEMDGKPLNMKGVKRYSKVIFKDGRWQLKAGKRSRGKNLFGGVVRQFGLCVVGDIYNNPELLTN